MNFNTTGMNGQKPLDSERGGMILSVCRTGPRLEFSRFLSSKSDQEKILSKTFGTSGTGSGPGQIRTSEKIKSRSRTI